MSAPTTRQWLRRAADRVAVGSGRLAARTVGRVIRAVRRRVGGWPWWVQLGLAFVALYRGPGVLARLGDWVHERVESGAGTGVLTVSALLWVGAAYRAGRDDVAADESELVDDEPGEPDVDEPEGAVEQLPATAPLPTFGQLCESLDRVGTPHAHIAVLAADLGTSAERVREALDLCGVVVEPVRMRGRGSSTGIKGDALPAPGSASGGVVAAAQPTNNDNNNAWYAVDDDHNPVRTHVVWHDQNTA